ncbi:MAG TPA: hypothetical protein VF442_05100, partial [Sphingobium sp.]
LHRAGGILSDLDPKFLQQVIRLRLVSHPGQEKSHQIRAMHAIGELKPILSIVYHWTVFAA